MLSITIAAHRALKGYFEAAMRHAVMSYINEKLSRSSKSGLLARRITSSKLCFSPESPIHISESQLNEKALFSSEIIEVLPLDTRPLVNINGWTFYLDAKDMDKWEESNFLLGEDLFLLIETDQISDADSFISEHKRWWTKDVTTVKLDEVCRRIAWYVGPPFYIVLACSRKNLVKVMGAYMSDLLVTDDPLLIRILSIVNVIGAPVDLIRSNSTTSTSSHKVTFRPLPNIMIFDAAEWDSISVKAIENNLNRILEPNTFITYRLSNEEWEGNSWCTSTYVLICLCEKLEDFESIKDQISTLVQKYGIKAVLLLPSNAELGQTELKTKGWIEVKFDNGLGRLFYLNDVTHLTMDSKLAALLTILGIKCRNESEMKQEIPEDTPLILCTGNDSTHVNNQYIYNLFETIGYRRPLTEDEYGGSKSRLIIPWKSSKSFLMALSNFRFDIFFSDQYEFLIPVTLVHADVLSSSWTMMTKIYGKLPNNSGLVISSSQQTAGKGRGKNSWLSPIGQLQMTMHCSTKFASPLGQCPSIFQHLIALMVITAIEEMAPQKRSKDVNIRLKWPNDIYWISDGISYKLGGIISQATFQGDNIHFIVGIGLNVSNEKPTVCLYNAFRSLDVEETDFPSIESIMRRIIINVQTSIKNLESGHQTVEAICREYERRWLHTNQNVTLKQDENSLVSCRIIGIDKYGFLLVEDTENHSETFSLHPDGNSFDLLHNLIRPK